MVYSISFCEYVVLRQPVFKERLSFIFQVLTCPEGMITWVASSDGTVLDNAVVGGKDPAGETYYIGRVNVDGRIIVGKIHPSHHVCYIASM